MSDALITVYTARRIHTMDPSLPEATALAVRGERIVEVGTLESLRPWLDSHEHVVDKRFADAVLLPGLVDPHVHPSSDFTTVGDIFSSVTNPDRKKPFDIRTVMRAVVDQDHSVLERWADMADADTSVVFDAHLAGIPVSVIGIESRAIPRKGWFPSDGPDQWTPIPSGAPENLQKLFTLLGGLRALRPPHLLRSPGGSPGTPGGPRGSPGEKL